MDYDLWTSTKRSRLIPASLPQAPVGELRTIYETYGASWGNPLSMASFAVLRASLGDTRDEVSGGELITLTSAPVVPTEAKIRRMELTVRKSDWHALAQRIFLGDAEYEISELLQESIRAALADPALLGEPTAPPKAPILVNRISESEPVPVLPPPTNRQLEDAEVRLRETLHHAGADVREVAEIEWRNGEIRLRLWTQTTTRKNEILAALEGIPYLSAEIYDAESSADSPALLTLPAGQATPKQLYSTLPPLAEALRKYLGGVDPANHYLDEVRDSYLPVLREASALERLTQRYPAEPWSRLPADLRNRLNRLAADYISAMRANAGNYRTTLSLALDEMLRAHGLPVKDTNETGDPGCESWREVTPDLLATLRRLQSAFWRMFVEERMEAPISLSAPDLLRDAAQARSQLLKEFNRLCQD